MNTSERKIDSIGLRGAKEAAARKLSSVSKVSIGGSSVARTSPRSGKNVVTVIVSAASHAPNGKRKSAVQKK